MMGNSTDLFLDRTKSILNFFAMWRSFEKPIPLKVYMAFIMTTQYLFLIFEIIYIVNVWGDMAEVSEASILLFTQASVCYKITSFISKTNNFVILLGLIESEIFSAQTELHEKILILKARKIKRLCMFFLVNAVTTCSLWAVIPLLDISSKMLPFKIWMPASTGESPHYELGYLYQMITIYISAFLFIGVDSVPLSMIMFGCAQLEIIMDKIGKVKSRPLDQQPMQRQAVLNSNYELLVECVRRYQSVVRFIELTEKTYHANIFFQLSGSVLIICNIGFRIAIVDSNSLQFYSMLTYLVTMLSQLFQYCWCGHELTIRGEELRETLYQSPWHEQDIRFRKVLIITMERMKRPIIFKAGHYIPLSRPTFVAILRCSYSYFAVLNRVRNE
uniref:Odorant receptor n=1 Tax=Bombyx mori TaxID=7091 RepID=A7E3I2_BOMMO|nr:TPA_exp: odorant receptor 41 [Bombyx mori]